VLRAAACAGLMTGQYPPFRCGTGGTDPGGTLTAARGRRLRRSFWRCEMARIEGAILIGRPVEEVFDFVADPRNEPSFNPAMTSIELLTPLPLGVGTRFRARMGRAGTPMLVELTEFNRPHRLGSRTTSPMMHTSGALTFAADGGRTVMSWDWQVRPKGGMRMLGPLFGPLGSRMERRIWASMKRCLENTAAQPATRPAH
jgi:carbon monoxide dehydrogenase subunit G